MTGRPSPPSRTTPRSRSHTPTHIERATRARRWLALHRRGVSASLAFAAVLVGLTAFAPANRESADAAGASVAPGGSALRDDQLQVPVRLSDPAVAQLLQAGDIVDLLGSDASGPATVIADRLAVLAIPAGADGSGWASNDSEGLVVVAATPEDALEIAGATARGPLTVAVHP